MAVITAAPSDSPPRPARRRPDAAIVRVAVVMVLLAAAISMLAYRQAYQPLASQGGLYWAGELTGDSSTFTQGRAARSVDNMFGLEEVVGPLPRGGRMGFLVSLRNQGRFAVTIVGVQPLLLDPLSRGTRFFAGPDDMSSDVKPTTHLTIPAHATRVVGFAIDVRPCSPGTPTAGGLRYSVDRVTFIYRFAGGTHTATVPLYHFAASVAFPTSCA